MIQRLLEKKIVDLLNKGKAIILVGARQVGKTTLLNMIFGNNSDVLWLSGDSPDILALF